MADIPYQQFPTVEPQGTPPNDYQNIQTNPGQFGAQVGQGEQALGAGVEQAGLEYTSIDATHKANALLDYAQKQLYGDPNNPNTPGALNLKGADAMHAVAAVTQRIHDMRQSLMDGLPPVGQQEFERATFNMDRAMVATAANHARDEMNTWAAGQAQAQQDLGLRSIAAGAARGDLDLVNAGREAVISGTVAQTQAKYGGHLSPEMTEDAIARGRSLAAVSHVRALAETNPQRASSILDAEADAGYLTGEQVDAMRRELKGPLDRAAAAGIVRNIIGGGGAPQSGAGGNYTPPPGDVAQKISATADHYGVSQNLAMATASIESDFGQDPSTNSPGKTYRGIYQLGPDEHNQMGGGDRDNADVQIDHGIKLLGQRKQQLAASLGREPTDAEVYLAHQQGVAGATALINHPDMPAGEAVTSAGGAPINIKNNGGNPDAPSRDFVNMWRGKFERRAAQFGEGTQSAQTPAEGGAPGSGDLVAVGDSIAAQQIHHGMAGTEADFHTGQNLPGTARVGAGTAEVLSRITATASSQPGFFQGKTVFNSTGASNSPAALGPVADQIKALQAAGAKNVVIPAVGSGVPNADRVNQQLEQIAKDNGAVFFKPDVKWAADGVHPTEVDKVKQQGLAALAQSRPTEGSGIPPGEPAGLIEPGNIDLTKRPIVKNPDGSISTVRSMSFNEDGQEVLIPTVAADGSRILGDQEAIDQYRKTGQFLGKFDTPDHATAYAQQLHEAQAQRYAPQPGPPQRADGLPPGFPMLEDWVSKIPDGLSDEAYNRVYADLSREHGRLVQATSAERGQVTAAVKGGLAMLSDGRDFTYDPAQIRRLFPADTAADMIGSLEDAKVVGQQKIAVQTMSPGQIADQLVTNDATLAHSSGPGYARQAKLADAFKTAVTQHFKELGEDPAAYVLATNPTVARAAQAAEAQKPGDSVVAGTGQPSPAETFASTMLGEQERLGVPADQRHVLSKAGATGLAQKITASPEQAPATLQAMAAQWGSAWPTVWRDIATAGKLPAAYQMVGALSDEGDGALLARALAGGGEKGKTEALDSQLDKGATGTTRPSQAIRTRIAGDEDVAKYAASMRASGASDQQINDIVSSVETLAKAKALYHSEDPAAAADHAIASAIGKFEYMPNGGARVPRADYDTVADTAAKTVAGLTLDKLAPPSIYGTPSAPGSATAEDWLRVLQAAPNWATVGQGIRLMDNGGRFVRTRDGGFVEVPFPTAAPPGATPQATSPAAPSPSQALSRLFQFLQAPGMAPY